MSLSKTNQQFFIMGLVALLNADKGIVNSLNTMAGGEGRTADTAKKVLVKYEESGGDIYEALEGFDETVRIAAHTSAQRGMLAGGLQGALDSLSVVSDSASKLKMEMAMPAFMSITMFCTLIWMGHYMLPSMANSVDRSRWPIATEMLLDLSGFVMNYWLVLAASTCALYAFYRWTLPNWEFSTAREYAERVIPGYYIYRLIQEQNFIELLSLQMQVATGVSPALAILKVKLSPYMVSHIDEMEYYLGGEAADIEDGSIAMESLDTGLIDKEKISLLVNLSQKGTDIPGALKTVVEQGRKGLEIKLGILGKLVLGVGVLMIMMMLILMMAAIVPLGFALMEQYNV